ncbi:ABC transporter permease [Chitinilyticum aquatile]|uniref:ABC transporter permease n=1 Tax=Chitinilyticum aquatile TaxID=362520 RepID=UPI00040A93AF|nr:ABC transporter permease [Chitinilyticum aquatile]
MLKLLEGSTRASLLVALTQREVQGRYKGSWLGLGWSLLGPMLMLLLYTLVFTEVMRARWPGISEQGGRTGFALMVYCGMLVHGWMAEILVLSPQALIRQSNYVKKVVFPLPLLPVVGVLAAGVNALIGLSLLLVLNAILGSGLHWSAIALPLVWLPLLLLGLGLAWLLTALGTYLRDIAQLTGFAATALLFASPVLYPASAVPAFLRPWMHLNPLTWLIESTRAVLLLGQWPDLGQWLLMLSLSTLLAFFGFWFFRRVQKGFADVL